PVEVVGNEAGTHALKLVLAALAAAEHGRARGFHRDHLDVPVPLLEKAAYTADRPTGAGAVHERVDPSMHLVPQLGARGFIVNARIRGVGKLIRHPRARLIANAFRL